MKELRRRPNLRLWLAIVGASTLVLGAAYAMVQQSTRLAADNLPLTTAESVRYSLVRGAEPKDVIPTVKTDLSSDSSAFVIITDSTRHILASSTMLSGKTPLPPSGVFEYTKTHGTDHFTWEPAPGVRLATRVLSYSSSLGGGFIIAGQSLKQTEDRINTYTALAVAAWVAVVGWVSLILILPTRKRYA